MSGRCFVISSCVCLLLLTAVLFGVVFWFSGTISPLSGGPSLTLHHMTLHQKNGYKPSSVRKLSLCPSWQLLAWPLYNRLKSPLLESVIKASTAENSLRGLAVYSNLTNACQPLDDVSNANMQVHKIALVTLVNESACTLQELATNAQNAGYSVLILPFAGAKMLPSTNVPTQNKLTIAVNFVGGIYQFSGLRYAFKSLNKTTVEQFFSDADRTNVDILCPNCNTPVHELRKMESYLVRLYYWFLVGPLITLEWLRRTKKLCWMSGGQQVDEQQAVINENVAENEIRIMEEGESGNEFILSNQCLLSNEDGSIGTHQGPEGSREGEYGSQRGERQPLLNPVNDENATQLRGTGNVNDIKRIFHKGVMCFAYIILIIAALPISISSGGLSFFRFDQGTSVGNTIAASFFSSSPDNMLQSGNYNVAFCYFLLLLIVSMWSPFQIFCFFLYSRFACNTTWAIPTNFSKLIRSHWFASNIYLLVLGVAVPYCTSLYNFGYFAIYNIVCTVCNVLFVIIVDKHKHVTRYVFYISVCMICAYIQSNIVAVFYFALNSAGSLNNLKLTALRTVAIGLTLSVSFSSTMHIIHKLCKPQESLFERLAEK